MKRTRGCHCKSKEVKDMVQSGVCGQINLIFFTRFKINISTHKTYPQHQDLLAGPWEEPREPEGNHERAVCTGLLQPWPPSSLWGHPSVQFHPVILYSICTLFLSVNSPDVSLNLGTPLKRMGSAEVSPFPFSSTPILTWRFPLPPTKQCMKVVLTILSTVHWNWLQTYYYFLCINDYNPWSLQYINFQWATYLLLKLTSILFSFGESSLVWCVWDVLLRWQHTGYCSHGVYCNTNSRQESLNTVIRLLTCCSNPPASPLINPNRRTQRD